MIEGIKIEAAVPLHCDLFSVEAGFVDKLGKRARNATEDEVRAYFDFLRRRAGLPDLGKPKMELAGYFGGRDNPICKGATFGHCGQHPTLRGPGSEVWQEGSYSIPMPGYTERAATVTMETLDDAGEVVATSTLPVEPKKGGVIWDRKAVRAAHGAVANARPAPTAVAEDPSPSAVTEPDPGAFDKFTDFVAARVGTRNWFVGRWSSRTRERYDARIRPADYKALETEFAAAHGGEMYPTAQKPAERVEPIPAVPQPEPLTDALSGREAGENNPIEPAGEPVAGVEARLAALEAQIATLSADNTNSANEGKNMQKLCEPKRTPAHERAIRRAWAERKAVRASRVDVAIACERADLWRERADEQRAKRQRAVLARRSEGQMLRDLHRRACHAATKALIKRKANALLARKRQQRIKGVVADWRAQLEMARRSPTYFDAESGLEKFDHTARSVHHANLAVERAERAEHAFAAMKARCERAEAARDQVAEALEAMASRIARAEAEIRRFQAAAAVGQFHRNVKAMLAEAG